MDEKEKKMEISMFCLRLAFDVLCTHTKERDGGVDTNDIVSVAAKFHKWILT